MIFSTKELVKLALCYIILMVSLSKCEIDSSSSPPAITTTTTSTTTTLPIKVHERADEKTLSSNGTSVRRAFSIPSSAEEAVKASHSYSSSSSSSLKDEPVAVTFNNSNEHWQQQQADESYNTSIISETIAPNGASPILTPSAPHASLQEAQDSDRAQGEKRGQQLAEQRQKLVKVQSQPRSNNAGQTVGNSETLYSSALGGASQVFRYNNNNINDKYYDKMSTGIGSHFPGKETSTVRAEANSETTAGRSMYSLTIIPQRQLSSSLPRRQVNPFSGLSGEGVLSSSTFRVTEEKQENQDSEDSEKNESSVPSNTWIPAGLTFSCKNRVPGYYADASPLSKCQVYHMCGTDGRKYTLLCGIGTVFNQLTFVCDHWYNYKCSEAESDYKINRRLWADLFEDDGAADKDEDELGDHYVDNDRNGGEAIIENDAVHQSVPLRSPFTITSKISKTRNALG